jgi:diamine N-acetyltransferase
MRPAWHADRRGSITLQVMYGVLDRHVPEFVAARQGDLDRLLGWLAELYRQDHIPFDAVVVRSALGDLLDQPTLGQVWLIALDGQPVGYLILAFGYSVEYGGRTALLDELFVAEAYRGRGLGSQALRFAADTCRQLGRRALQLEVDRNNQDAQRLYRAAGFVDHDRYLMSLRLTPRPRGSAG